MLLVLEEYPLFKRHRLVERCHRNIHISLTRLEARECATPRIAVVYGETTILRDDLVACRRTDVEVVKGQRLRTRITEPITAMRDVDLHIRCWRTTQGELA